MSTIYKAIEITMIILNANALGKNPDSPSVKPYKVLSKKAIDKKK